MNKNRKFILILLCFSFSLAKAQVNIKVIEIKKKFKVEYLNKSKTSIEVDNISFRNFDDECKTTGYLNQNSYKVVDGILMFDFNYYPNCFHGNYKGDLKIRKISIPIDDTFIQVFKIPRKQLKKVDYLILSYYVNGEIVNHKVKTTSRS